MMTVSLDQFRVVMIWTLLLVGMVLHFNYHVSKVFYMESVMRPGADGTLPLMVYALRNVFYHLPILFIVLALYGRQTWIRGLLFLVSLPYTIAHILHVIDECNKPTVDWFGQVVLLSMLLGLSVLLNVTSWRYWQMKSGMA